MVVPRVERRAAAGLIVTLATESGMTATDESLLRGAVRASLATGVAVSHTFGADPLAEIDIALDEALRRNVWCSGESGGEKLQSLTSPHVVSGWASTAPGIRRWSKSLSTPDTCTASS